MNLPSSRFCRAVGLALLLFVFFLLAHRVDNYSEAPLLNNPKDGNTSSNGPNPGLNITDTPTPLIHTIPNEKNLPDLKPHPVLAKRGALISSAIIPQNDDTLIRESTFRPHQNLPDLWLMENFEFANNAWQRSGYHWMQSGEILIHHPPNQNSKINSTNSSNLLPILPPHLGERILRQNENLTVLLSKAVSPSALLQEIEQIHEQLPPHTLAEPQWIFFKAALPNDPGVTDSPQKEIFQLIRAEEGWALKNTALSVRIAVLDTGIGYNIEDLKPNIFVNSQETQNNRDSDRNGYVDDVHGYDFVDNDPDPMDEEGHGTHVASIIAAIPNNGIGTAGIVWQTQLVPIRVLNNLGYGTTEQLHNGLDYAQSLDCRILNLSLGSYSYSEATFNKFKQLQNRGILAVAAAGNPDSQKALDEVSLPAGYDLDNILSVGSSMPNGTPVYGTTQNAEKIDIFAPGKDVGGIDLHTGKFISGSGSSYAAAFASGLAALVFEMQPSLSPAAHIKRIMLGGSYMPDSLMKACRSAAVLNIHDTIAYNHSRNSIDLTKFPRDFEQVYGSPLLIEPPVQVFHRSTFQWYLNDILFSEKNTPNLFLYALKDKHAGRWRLEILSQDQHLISPEFTLNIFQSAPQILQTPNVEEYYFENETIEFTPHITGSMPIKITWFNAAGNRIHEGPSYIINNIKAWQADTFHFTAENDIGKITSPPLEVNVVPNPNREFTKSYSSKLNSNESILQCATDGQRIAISVQNVGIKVFVSTDGTYFKEHPQKLTMAWFEGKRWIAKMNNYSTTYAYSEDLQNWNPIVSPHTQFSSFMGYAHGWFYFLGYEKYVFRSRDFEEWQQLPDLPDNYHFSYPPSIKEVGEHTWCFTYPATTTPLPIYVLQESPEHRWVLPNNRKGIPGQSYVVANNSHFYIIDNGVLKKGTSPDNTHDTPFRKNLWESTDDLLFCNQTHLFWSKNNTLVITSLDTFESTYHPISGSYYNQFFYFNNHLFASGTRFHKLLPNGAISNFEEIACFSPSQIVEFKGIFLAIRSEWPADDFPKLLKLARSVDGKNWYFVDLRSRGEIRSRSIPKILFSGDQGFYLLDSDNFVHRSKDALFWEKSCLPIPSYKRDDTEEWIKPHLVDPFYIIASRTPNPNGETGFVYIDLSNDDFTPLKNTIPSTGLNAPIAFSLHNKYYAIFKGERTKNHPYLFSSDDFKTWIPVSFPEDEDVAFIHSYTTDGHSLHIYSDQVDSKSDTMRILTISSDGAKSSHIAFIPEKISILKKNPYADIPLTRTLFRDVHFISSYEGQLISRDGINWKSHPWGSGYYSHDVVSNDAAAVTIIKEQHAPNQIGYRILRQAPVLPRLYIRDSLAGLRSASEIKIKKTSDILPIELVTLPLPESARVDLYRNGELHLHNLQSPYIYHSSHTSAQPEILHFTVTTFDGLKQESPTVVVQNRPDLTKNAEIPATDPNLRFVKSIKVRDFFYDGHYFSGNGKDWLPMKVEGDDISDPYPYYVPEQTGVQVGDVMTWLAKAYGQIHFFATTHPRQWKRIDFPILDIEQVQTDAHTGESWIVAMHLDRSLHLYRTPNGYNWYPVDFDTNALKLKLAHAGKVWFIYGTEKQLSNDTPLFLTTDFINIKECSGIILEKKKSAYIITTPEGYLAFSELKNAYISEDGEHWRPSAINSEDFVEPELRFSKTYESPDDTSRISFAIEYKFDYTYNDSSLYYFSTDSFNFHKWQDDNPQRFAKEFTLFNKTMWVYPKAGVVKSGKFAQAFGAPDYRITGVSMQGTDLAAKVSGDGVFGRGYPYGRLLLKNQRFNSPHPEDPVLSETEVRNGHSGLLNFSVIKVAPDSKELLYLEFDPHVAFPDSDLSNNIRPIANSHILRNAPDYPASWIVRNFPSNSLAGTASDPASKQISGGVTNRFAAAFNLNPYSPNPQPLRFTPTVQNSVPNCIEFHLLRSILSSHKLEFLQSSDLQNWHTFTPDILDHSPLPEDPAYDVVRIRNPAPESEPLFLRPKLLP